MLNFTKMEGCGNDYVYVDARAINADWPTVARNISDRHFGVGSDGLILIMDSAHADLKMRMFNADGSEGEMCGNGIRCFAKYVIDRNIIKPIGKGLSVETLAGIRNVKPVMENGVVTNAKVDMGTPTFHPEDIPVTIDHTLGRRVEEAVVNYPLSIDGVDLELTFVSMGNPHAVAFLEEPIDQFPLHSIGPKVEHHAMFPNRVNFEIVNLQETGSLNARVWERGSGETMACGTGACAIAVAAHLLNITAPSTIDKGRDLRIKLPGGVLSITWDGNTAVQLEGPAVEVFTGQWQL